MTDSVKVTCVRERERETLKHNELWVIWQEMKSGKKSHEQDYIRGMEREEMQERDSINKGVFSLRFSQLESFETQTRFWCHPVFLSCPITLALPVPNVVMSQDSWGCHVHLPRHPSALSLSGSLCLFSILQSMKSLETRDCNRSTYHKHIHTWWCAVQHRHAGKSITTCQRNLKLIECVYVSAEKIEL